MDRRAFFLRRLHSLTGVVPVGVFLVLHLWTNASALGGQEPFDRAVRDIDAIPALPLVELLFVLAPLSFHAGYGLVLAWGGRANASSYPFTRKWLYVFQRVTGVLVLAFVLAHLWELRVQKALFGLSPALFYPRLAADLSWSWQGLPLVALGYLVGLAASTFHLANGLVTFSITWGIVTGDAGRRNMARLSSVFGLLLFGVSAATVVELATGTPLMRRDIGGMNVPCGPGAEASPGAPSPARLPAP